MKKTLFLIMLMIFLFTGIAGAREIDEIVIQGLTRSDEELVRKQLPYNKGDQWTEELEELTKKRLSKMRTFNPISLAVTTEKIEKDKVKVVITAEDPNPFMIHPVEFGVFKAIDLASEQITQYALNPFGNGVNFNAGVNWSSDPWWGFGVDYVGSKGRKYSINYKDFESSEEYNNVEYEEKGYNLKVRVQQILNYDLSLNNSLKYQDNIYQQDTKVKQEYLLLGTKIIYERYGELDLGIEYGYDLADNNCQFGLFTLRWDKINKIDVDELIFSVKSGAASSNTPFNYQFKAGGYSSLPLRGIKSNLAGVKYLVGNTEYHKTVIKDSLWIIGFLDAGKIIPADSSFSEKEWKLNGGGGLAVATPFGPVRGDVGFNLLDNGHELNLTLGHTF